MECGNPDCDKGELLKKILAFIEKEEEIPKFCPFCKSPLQRSTFEKPKDETSTSQATEKAKKRDYGRNTEESRKDETNTPLKDEKATEATSQYVHDDGSPIASGTDRRLSEDATNANQTSEGDATCSTTGQALQDSSATESQEDETNTSLKDQKATEATATSQYVPDDGPPIARGTDTKLSEDATNKGNQTSEGTATFSTTGQTLQATSAIDSLNNNHESVNTYIRTFPDQELSKESGPQKYPLSKSDPEKEPEVVTCAKEKDITSSSDHFFEIKKVHVNQNTNSGFDQSEQKLIKNRTESFSYETQSIPKTFEKPSGNVNLDSKKQIDSQQNQNENISSSTNKVTILGVTVFGNSDASVTNACEKHPPSSNNDSHHHAENVLAVQKDNIQNQIESSSMLNNNNNDDKKNNNNKKETSNTENNNESPLRNESNKNGKEQEVEDYSAYDICDDEEQSISEEEMPSGQGKGSMCYDKEVIKQKRKERRSKRKQGGKKDNVPKDEKVQTDRMKEKEHLSESQKQNQLPGKNSQQTDEPVSSSAPDQQDHLQHQQQSGQEPRNQQAIFPPTDKMAEDCVTIVFHGLLSPDFHFKPNEQTIAIRAGHEELFSWKWDCADIKPIRKTTDKFWLLRGEMQLPVRLLLKPIPYKYVVCSIKDKTVHWEYSEFSDDFRGTIVDRSLTLFDTHKKEGAIWHQYDGVIYPGPEEKSTWKFWQWWGNNRDLVLKNRQLAAKTFLPKWKGFVRNTDYEPMSATEAIERTTTISECLINVYISPYLEPVRRTVPGLEFNKILIEFLRPMLQYNAKLTQKDLESSEVRVDRLVSSLAITHLIAYYRLDQDLMYVQLRDIIHCLVLQAKECEFHEIHKHFPEYLWSELAEDIVFLLTSAIRTSHMHSCPDVILAVPLLHFLRKDCKPFEEPEETQANKAEEWCHLEGLPQNNLYTRFLEHFLPDAMPMFSLDPLLRRAFLYFSPLQDFPTLSGNIVFPVHEICTALRFKIRAENIFKAKFDAINETLSGLMKRFQTPREEKGELSKTLLCLRSAKPLLEELKKTVEIKDKVFLTGVQFAVIAFSTVDDPEDERKMLESDHQNQEKDDGIKHECEAFFFGIVDMVEDAIEKEFYSKIAISRDRQIKELEAWTTILNLNINKLQNTWTENLVPLFNKRLKKVFKKLTHVYVPVIIKKPGCSVSADT